MVKPKRKENVDPVQALREHIGPFIHVYDKINKASKREKSGFMKRAPFKFINNIGKVAKNVHLGSFELNPEQFKFFKKRKNLLRQASGNKRQAVKAFRSQRGGTLAVGIQSLIRSALKCPTQNHTQPLDPENSSSQKRCKGSTP